MPQITLPDGSRRQFDAPVTVLEIAQAIGAGLARAALAGRVGGRLVDTSATIAADAEVSIITDRDEAGVDILRHSTAHLLAHAVKSLFPEAQVTIGPIIEDGFYYDFAFPRGFKPEDLIAIEAKMAEIAKVDYPVTREVLSRADAIAFFRGLGEEYKAKIIEGLPPNEEISLYRQGDFVDLCRGPHVPSTSRLKAFKLTKLAGAYWRGDAANDMLQRIYGTAWPNQAALQQYLDRLEQAERRDHRRIGRELDLFSLQEDAGGGLVFWHPKGARVRRVIEDHWRERHVAGGYELLYTPHIALQTLWDTSGHTDFYRDSMYQPMVEDEQLYQLKPMNCPFHILIYKDRLRSYRELPFRWAELGTVYRHEMSGALHGLMRVRGFTQDDAHIFCTAEDIGVEITRVLDFVVELLTDFGFSDYVIQLSTRPEKSVGSDAIWQQSTDALHDALRGRGLEYGVDAGGGAFYGPKIDLQIRDAIGRRWQCSTIQLDFNLPERFGMEYVGADGHRHRPIMIHRALLGSLERFFGILVEHYEGRFLPWLAPVQASVLSITEEFADYADEVAKILRNQGFRVEPDLRNEKIGLKIREHTLQRVPYMLVVGRRERLDQTVAVRARDGEDLGAMNITQFVDRLRTEIGYRCRGSNEERKR